MSAYEDLIRARGGSQKDTNLPAETKFVTQLLRHMVENLLAKLCSTSLGSLAMSKLVGCDSLARDEMPVD